MTIEGRPDLIPDPLFDEQMMKSYNDQRRDRLGDVISDYLSDEEKTAKEFYDDLIAEIDDWMRYHERFAEKYKAAKMMINGHRNSTISDRITNYEAHLLSSLEKDAWQNFPNETGDHITP